MESYEILGEHSAKSHQRPSKSHERAFKDSSVLARTHDVRAFLCPHPVRAHRVKGTPYLEDLASRYPSSQLHLRLEPPEKLDEERLYEILRRYGQLDDLQASLK